MDQRLLSVLSTHVSAPTASRHAFKYFLMPASRLASYGPIVHLQRRVNPCLAQRNERLKESASGRKSELTDGGVVSEVLANAGQVALHFDALCAKTTAPSGEQTHTGREQQHVKQHRGTRVNHYCW